MVKVQEFINRVRISSHEELAEKLGVEKGTVSSWSSGVRNPTYKVCIKLLDMGMTVEELFGKDYSLSVSNTEEELQKRFKYFMKKMIDNLDRI